MESRPRFHLALAVDDLVEARRFYGEVLGLREGRSDIHWVDFDLFGHQLVVHESARVDGVVATNPVDGDAVPVPHFGCLLERPVWDTLADRLRGSGIEFVIEPHVRFAGEVGEQATMFFLDPAGNALEFKSFRDDADVFRRNDGSHPDQEATT